MKKLVIASCAVVSLGLAGCTQTSESRGALRGGGIGAAAGTLAARAAGARTPANRN
jgi:hypothetical protein